MSVMIGIDPHKALHAVCAIDRHETELAEVVVDRIRGLLAAPLPVDAVEVQIDVCIGVAIYPTDSREAPGLLAAADAAMYVGKRAITRVA